MRVGTLDSYTDSREKDRKMFYFMAVFGAVLFGFFLVIGSRILGGMFKVLFKYWYAIPITLLLIFFLRRRKKK